LILDGGNGTLVSPIDGVGEVSDGGGDGVGSNEFLVVFIESTSGVLKLEFGGRHVSELVKGEFSISVFSIESVDLVEVFNKDTESHGFFNSRVGLLVLDLPGIPKVGETVRSEGGSEADNGNSNPVI